jgi:hypothetical protein
LVHAVDELRFIFMERHFGGAFSSIGSLNPFSGKWIVLAPPTDRYPQDDRAC